MLAVSLVACSDSKEPKESAATGILHLDCPARWEVDGQLMTTWRLDGSASVAATGRRVKAFAWDCETSEVDASRHLVARPIRGIPRGMALIVVSSDEARRTVLIPARYEDRGVRPPARLLKRLG